MGRGVRCSGQGRPDSLPAALISRSLVFRAGASKMAGGGPPAPPLSLLREHAGQGPNYRPLRFNNSCSGQGLSCTLGPLRFNDTLWAGLRGALGRGLTTGRFASMRVHMGRGILALELFSTLTAVGRSSKACGRGSEAG